MIELLPPRFDDKHPEMLSSAIKAARSLGELKGVTKTIPNENVLLDTLVFNEAKASTAIENIITTYDELFRANVGDTNVSPATKEAKNYADAVKHGYRLIKEGNTLSINTIKKIQKINAPNHYQVRKIPGTMLKNEHTGETIYTPPQNYNEIMKLLGNLEKFINDNRFSSLDPIIKMCVMHYQFESIHPFHDGNGRMGRILNILYLTQEKLLDIPILYLSQYIIDNKKDYYKLLRDVTNNKNWTTWICWLIRGVEKTSNNTISKITKITNIMFEYKKRIKKKYKFYSQDLINVLFRYPYTKIEFITKELGVSRPTATNYLDALDKGHYLRKEKIGRDNFYFNLPLFDILKGN